MTSGRNGSVFSAYLLRVDLWTSADLCDDRIVEGTCSYGNRCWRDIFGRNRSTSREAQSMPRCEVRISWVGISFAGRGLRLRKSRRCSPSRCGLFLFMMIVPAAVYPVSALADKSSVKFPGKTSNWNGFVRYDFQVGGRSVLVVSPMNR